jgi:hypothetical protein
MNRQSWDFRNGLLCAIIVAAGIWASFPVAEIGFVDDWSYVRTAQLFAKSGHFIYNGWATAMLGWQVLCGALFIKIFGFSFTVARLSMLPVAMATVFLLYSCLRRFQVSPANAIFGSLTFGLSPMFLPLAASFMSDVPGTFVIVLCLYLCKRAIDAGTPQSTIAWLSLAVASNLVGGSVRQIAWLGALVMVPSTGWLLRKRRNVLPVSVLLLGISALIIFLCMLWFNRQPYSLPEPLFEPLGNHPVLSSIHLLIELMGTLLCLLLMVYPILVAWLPEFRSLTRAAFLRIAFITAAWGCVERALGWTMPWLFSLINIEFDPKRTGQMTPPAFSALPAWGREIISLLVVATALIFIEQLRIALRSQSKTQVNQTPRGNSLWLEILWLIGPFTACYVLLLMPRGYRLVIFDRYVLLIMPGAIICLLLLHEQLIAKPISAISVVTLTIFSLLAIGGTHDWFAWYRAKAQAAREIRATGIPRTEIDGGLAYDGWTEIEAAGYINEPRLIIPAGAYHPNVLSQSVPAPCRYDFTPFIPAIHPTFSMVFAEPMPCLAPSKFAPVYYRKWLPPFSGVIYIQKIPEVQN